MVKVSVNRFVSRRVETTRKQVNTGTQKLRNKTLSNLEQIFRATSRIGKGEKTQDHLILIDRSQEHIFSQQFMPFLLRHQRHFSSENARTCRTRLTTLWIIIPVI